MRWQLDVPDASDLIPETAGRLAGQGTVLGPPTQPLINARLDVQSFRAWQWIVDRLVADLNVDLSYQKKSDINLVGQGLGAGDQRINQPTSVSIRGPFVPTGKISASSKVPFPLPVDLPAILESI